MQEDQNQNTSKESLLSQLPKEFINFLESEGIELSVFFTEQSTRYIRIKPLSNLNLNILKQDFCAEAQETQLRDIYAIPNDFKISQNKLYKDGLVYGIDYSSAAVVVALDIRKEDKHILEICCSPGAKLTYIADLLKTHSDKDNIQRKVVGVDISQQRLNVTKSIVEKYKLNDFVELFQTDGTTFKSEIKFDKVLVDAECTHEGSIKHLKKYIQKPINQLSKKNQKNQKQSQKQLQKNHTNKYLQQYTKSNEWSQQDFIDRFLDQKKLESITDLQYRLLLNGFNNLKQGGILIYSTCSFSKKQNEDIIMKFLSSNHDAQLICPFNNQDIKYKDGGIKMTARFDPVTTNSGGMFIAKLQKQ